MSQSLMSSYDHLLKKSTILSEVISSTLSSYSTGIVIGPSHMQSEAFTSLPNPINRRQIVARRMTEEQVLCAHLDDLEIYKKWIKSTKDKLKQQGRDVQKLRNLKKETATVTTAFKSLLSRMEIGSQENHDNSCRCQLPVQIPEDMENATIALFLQKYHDYQVPSRQNIEFFKRSKSTS
ncbi:uncharacterized protein LOC144446776 [Glandiceps talaboti]